MTEESKMLGKKKCECGRKIIVARKDGRLSGVPNPVYSTCKTYGLKESKRLFVEEQAQIKKKNPKTVFKITKGVEHINAWKKKK